MKNKINDKICAILLNGNISLDDFAWIDIKDYDFLICVDGAGNFLKETRILPDLLMGDFDSIEKLNYEYFLSNEVKVKKYPAEKDYTDSQLAIHVAIENGYNQIHIYGGFGNRADHTLGNIGLILYGYRLNTEVTLIDKNNRLFLLKEGEITLTKEAEKVFSIIPIYEDLKSISITGAKYNLKKEVLIHAEPRGISNEFIGNNVKIVNEIGLGLICISNKI